METGTEGPPEGEERRSIDTPGEQPSPSRNSPSKREIRILVGLILVTLGVAIFLDHAEGNTRALRILGDWWPVSIIAWGLVNVLRLIERRWMLGGPLSAILLGGLLLVWTLDNQTGRWLMAFLWPTAIVLVGFWLVLAAVESGEHRSTHSDELRRAVCFRGMYLTQGAQPLRRANITVLFGTLELDLRESDFKQMATMNVNVAFGIVVVLVAEGIGYEVLRPFVLGVHGLVGDSRWVHQGTPSLRINTLGLLGDVRVDTPGVSKSRSGSSDSV